MNPSPAAEFPAAKDQSSATSQTFASKLLMWLDFDHGNHRLSYQDRHGGADSNFRFVGEDGWVGYLAFSADAGPEATVLSLKKRIEFKTGVPVERLLFGGKQLGDYEALLKTYNVTNLSTIHLAMS